MDPTKDFASTLNANNPGFIQKYFASSRLHHLSSWKADLVDFIGNMMKNKASSQCDDDYRTIMHIDMDCFFASVGLRDKPHLRDKPVVVAHSIGGVAMDFSSSELASCNYIARSKGVKNGMYLGTAKELAPDLVVIPYEFEKYDECTRALYQILIQSSDFVQAVSCDEAFIDVTKTIARDISSLKRNQLDTFLEYEKAVRTVAENIRDQIFKETGCTASVGIAHNILLARLATRQAKPNGCHFIRQSDTHAIISELPIKDLPGCGWSTEQKLLKMKVETCGDLRNTPIALLQRELGTKTAETLRAYSLGQDSRILENRPRQTIGAEINWGIRFTTQNQISNFLKNFCDEVFARLQKSEVTARHLTVNIKKKLYEGEPTKFLGMGNCEDHSKSLTLNFSFSRVDQLTQQVAALVKELMSAASMKPADLRGVGIHLKKLVPNHIKQASNGNGGSRSKGLHDYFTARADHNDNPPPPAATSKCSGAAPTCTYTYSCIDESSTISYDHSAESHGAKRLSTAGAATTPSEPMLPACLTPPPLPLPSSSHATVRETEATPHVLSDHQHHQIFQHHQGHQLQEGHPRILTSPKSASSLLGRWLQASKKKGKYTRPSAPSPGSSPDNSHYDASDNKVVPSVEINPAPHHRAARDDGSVVDPETAASLPDEIVRELISAGYMLPQTANYSIKGSSHVCQETKSAAKQLKKEKTPSSAATSSLGKRVGIEAFFPSRSDSKGTSASILNEAEEGAAVDEQESWRKEFLDALPEDIRREQLLLLQQESRDRIKMKKNSS